MRTLVSGPREDAVSFCVIFSGLGELFFSFGFGRRSFQAVFITYGEKSRPERCDNVGLGWVVFEGLLLPDCAVFDELLVDLMYESEDD